MKIDRQTLKDLEIFENFNGVSIFDIANLTLTPGGEKQLRKFFSSPKNTKKEIVETQELFKYIMNNSWRITLHKNQIYFIQNYLQSKIQPIKNKNNLLILLKGTLYRFNHRDSGLFSHYEYIKEGIYFLKDFLDFLYDIYESIEDNAPKLIRNIATKIYNFLKIDAIAKLYNKKYKKLSFIEIFKYDHIFRHKLVHEIHDMIRLFFKLDALISISKFIQNYNLTFPTFVESEKPYFEAQDLYHIFLSSPVKNSFKFTQDTNFLFLTGPNMSGKTTFLKSCGLCLYFAHLGIGVPAKSLKLTSFDEIISDINTQDNIQMGYSYFYNEVKRVKYISKKISGSNRVFVLLDELFRGTNVHDAFEGTKRVIGGFTNWTNSLFILSSHLVELEKNIKNFPGICFKHFDSKVKKNTPSFTYILKEGVSRKRIGLLILENENIFKILNKDQLSPNK
ncbi:MAG: hypothetical protein FXF47_06185 [Candidatus Mcinerneyibacterium aminivorans]|uniref:DNA mismatch repair proteins mutS family domain-containing protein n=1 Tax=Candidatus Mcinerneyibacterium aminivorans TaxID=2703815 RepID=A0A5D0MHV4_9BACT|nr:MAG: hypothetical protein FXF47_06185 [Candidatus Mcinerneyibacterium aminivorans]